MKRAPLLVVLGLLALAVAVPVTGGQLGLFGATATPAPGIDTSLGGPGDDDRPSSAEPGLASPTPNDEPDATDEAPSSEPTDPASSPPSPQPAEPALAETDVAVVPVTQFRTTRTSASAKEIAAILAGTSDRYDALELVADEADAILEALGTKRPAATGRLIEADDAAALQRDLAKHRQRLGFLRADAVGPGVRALSWGGASLFGNGRVRDLADWSLTARLPGATAARAFDPASTWTLVAGGDIMLDRGVYDVLRNKGKGEDFPFDGGTAEITGRTCCSSFGWKVPTLRRTGDKGAVRDLIEDADIALANFENPAPNRFSWHTKGTVFSADPTLIDGIVDAGFDVVGVANNHIRDQGGNGLLQTVKNLRKRGLLTAGAGKDLAAARQPAIIETHGVKVAILAYDAIAGYYHATADKIGSAPMKLKVVRADIKAARAAGADVVIVFPHWGIEYRATPGAGQQQLARQVIDAGADMIIGNHAHWTAAMETYKGKPIWYALGNLVFDQTWSEETMEGMTLELTFHGERLVQARIRPHVILDKAQPNFLDPAGDGKIVMDRVFKASKGLLAW